MPLSNPLIQQALDHAFNKAAMTSIATTYAALFTSAPDANGAGGTEVSGGAYARVAVPSANLTRTAQTLNNNTAITFPESTAAWGNVTHGALYTASTGGTFLGFGTLPTARNITAAGVTPVVAINGLNISIT